MSVFEKVNGYLETIKKNNPKFNIFLSLNENILQEAKNLDLKKEKKEKLGKLFGIVFGVKSNIAVKGMEVNCASKCLEGYISGYDASVIENIKKEDGLIIGMLNMDEFACGSSGETSAFGACQNPACLGRIPGGSSSGSAAAIAAKMCDVTLGSDTGGSIRNPASHCGVIGMKPSYGAVSRYGLIDLSMSLDQIGVLSDSVKNVSNVFEVISGVDDRDTKTIDYSKKKDKIEKLKIGILKVDGVDGRILNVFNEKIKLLKKLGWNFKEVKVDHLDLAVETYYPIVYVEFFSGTRKFDGRRFGKKIEESCGKEVLRRILGGSEISKAEFEGEYYEKALMVKRLISKEFEKIFENVDVIICPVTPNLPWKIGEGNEMNTEQIYASDSLTTPANLAGICSIVLPAGFINDSGDQVPIGFQVMCAKGNDFKLLEIAKLIESYS